MFSVCIDRLRSDARCGSRRESAHFRRTGTLLIIHCWNLEVDAARDLRRRLDTLLRHRDARPPARVCGLNRIAFSLWLELEHEEAAHVLDEAVALADSNGLCATEAFLFFGRHQLAIGQRDHTAIESNIEELRQILNPSRRLGQSVLLRALTDHTLLQGNAAAAVELGEQAVALAEEAGTRPLQSTWRLSSRRP